MLEIRYPQTAAYRKTRADNNMKRANIFGIVVALAITPAAMANFISVEQTLGASFRDGGEYTARTSPITEILGLSQSPGTFQTFCLESHIFLSLDTKYSYTKTQEDHSGNSLKLGTAWLFSKFSTHSLPGFIDDSTQAGLLQGAIWFFQGQTPNQDPAGFNDSSTNPYVIDAMTALGGSAGNASAGAFGVFMLELTDANGKPAQDLLGLTPVPDGGATIALLGLALVGFEGLRRRLA